MASLELIATSAFGLEALVKRELADLGYPSQVVQPGRILFRGPVEAICRANLWLRTSERVLLCLGRFEASDFDALFEQTRQIAWHEWIPPDGAFPVRGRSHKSQLSSVPAIQRSVKKAIVESLQAAHGVALPESGAEYPIEIALVENQAMLSLDTSGPGLHKRGYRPASGPAPLRETLAAALVQLSFWQPDRPLIDPFCGTGTIAIEAALIGRRIAPGLQRTFAAERWPAVGREAWESVRDAAREIALPELPTRIIGTDMEDRALSMARRNAESAGVAEDIHFQRRAFADLASKSQYGCVIGNPPYGNRLGDQREAAALYEQFPIVLRRLPTWSHFILTAHPRFEAIVGQTADRRRKMYNGRIPCQYYQFHGPRPPRADAESKEPTAATVAAEEGQNQAPPDESPPAERPSAAPPRRASPQPVFGGLDEKARQQAELFRNRLAKRARHLRRWPKRGITCFRLYERDIPEVPLVVDRYEDRLHMAEFARPHDRTPAEHADWLDLMQRTAGEVLDVPRKHVYMKFRDRQRGARQYERQRNDSHIAVVQEGGLRFKVNLSEYVDTGLFLDHRITRGMIREQAKGTRFLNLFGYTGSFTVYAAAGGAASTTTVDLSRTYLNWAEANLGLNGLSGTRHALVESDAGGYLDSLPRRELFDLVVVDPPTFSNSKDLDEDWDVQRDHAGLLAQLLPRLAPNGVIYFSTNFRRFKLAEHELAAQGLSIHEISKQTVPEDFRNRRIHRCWRMVRGESS